MKITYSYNLQSKKLIRRSQPLVSVISSEDDFSETELAQDLEDFRCRFYYFDEDLAEYIWKDSWNRSEGFPLGVQIEIIKDKKSFNRTIFRG